jgi:amidase
MLAMLLLGILFLREPRFQRGEEVFLHWLLENSQTRGATVPLTVIEIGSNPLEQKAAGEKESTEAFLHTGGSTISPLEYALFLQSVLEFQPTVVAFENILKWRVRDKDQEQVFLDQAMRVPKLLLGAELTDTPDPDAPVVERMRAAGAIPIARTNLPDMALRVHTDSSLHGLTRNPWHPGRTAGGSSGGEASALASGMSPIGLGNDIGGSLRNPATACGIASIRPSAGRVPDAGYVPAEDRLLAVQLMHVQGPMARRVADVRLGLRILMGAHPRDPWSVDAPFDGPPLARPVRVAVLPEPPGGSTHPEVAAAVRRAADALADDGFKVTEATPPDYEQALELWSTILIADLRVMKPVLDELMGAGGRQFLDYALGYLPESDVAAWAMAHTARHGLARRWSLWYQEYPVLLSPVWTQPAFPLDFDIASLDNAIATLELMRPVLPANLLGTPAAVVPAGMAEGLPVGVQVMGGKYTELRCLAVAEAIEQRLGTLTPIDPVAG